MAVGLLDRGRRLGRVRCRCDIMQGARRQRPKPSMVCISASVSSKRERFGPMLEGDSPPVFRHLAIETGTDVAGYLSEEPRCNIFALADGVVYHTYSTGARQFEFLMGYYPILDRAPKGRAEEGSEFWIRRHDEYDE